MLRRLLADAGDASECQHIVFNHQTPQVVRPELREDGKPGLGTDLGDGREHDERLPLVPCGEAVEFKRIFAHFGADEEADPPPLVGKTRKRVPRHEDLVPHPAVGDDDTGVARDFGQTAFDIRYHASTSCVSMNGGAAYTKSRAPEREARRGGQAKGPTPSHARVQDTRGTKGMKGTVIRNRPASRHSADTAGRPPR